MVAAELRIGNAVFNSRENKVQIVNLFILDSLIKGSNEYRPIELTEEWLLKFGFNTDYKPGYIGIDINNSDFVLTNPLKMGDWQTNFAFQFETGNVPKFKQIEYVHQLQNLYFALNGEELIIKNG